MPPTAKPQCATADDGTLLYTWNDTVVIEVMLHASNKSGRYPVITRYKGDQINKATVDLLNLKDRADIEAHCRALDGQVNWLQRFQHVAELLPARVETSTTWELVTTTLSMVKPKRVDFYWKPLIPKGRPVSLDGDPGVGKSALIAKLMAHLTTGKAFPTLLDGTSEHDFTPHHVCLMSAEDDPADTILPRVAVNTGDPSRVHILEGRRNGKGEVEPITMQDLPMLHTALDRWRPALLIFDPVQSYFGRGVDMNHANDTRPILDAVAGLCKPYHCTPFYVRHIGKALRSKALHAGLGSIDIAANMRSVLYLAKDPENPLRRILAHSKSNNARLGPSMAYLLTTITQAYSMNDGEEITIEAPRVDWDGRSPLTADDLNAPLAQENEEEKTALDEARDFLRELLQDAPVFSKDVAKAAKEAGMAWATVRRAKALEGVKVRKQEGHGEAAPWEWYMPDDPSDQAPSEDHDDVPF
jgi:putative DNA primase/helicase